jgi:ABC-2 type transport system ATP-binding protein
LRADSGEVRVLNGDPWRDTASLHRRIAYCPGDVNLWPNLSGGEVIDLFGRLRGDLDRKRRDELLDRFELDPKKKGRSYSKGNRQKVAIVAALASDAELLILDEPTTGLDPIMEVEFQRAIHEVKAEGRTVFLSSHILSEVEALCDRVTIIRAGRTVESGTLEDLRHLTRTAVTATLSSDPRDFNGGPGVHDLVIEGNKISMSVESDAMNSVLKLLTDYGVESLKADPPTLEELFLRHYADELR